MLVYDVTDLESFRYIDDWLRYEIHMYFKAYVSRDVLHLSG